MKKLSLIVLLSISIFTNCKEKETTIDESCVECKVNSLGKTDADLYLSGKLSEIQTLTSNIPCTDATKWSAVAIGAKACGGPSGYVANHTSLNQEVFLKKVSDFTAAQVAYNKKFGAISDCSVMGIPRNVECVNGKPRFF